MHVFLQSTALCLARGIEPCWISLSCDQESFRWEVFTREIITMTHFRNQQANKEVNEKLKDAGQM